MSLRKSLPSQDNPAQPELERLLAQMLHYGTWLAAAVIAAGLTLALSGEYLGPHGAVRASGMGVVLAGIALFILLPVSRVAMMLIIFLRQRDYRFGAVCALVLTIILLSFALGAAAAAV